jgi:hypothetical protein
MESLPNIIKNDGEKKGSAWLKAFIQQKNLLKNINFRRIFVNKKSDVNIKNITISH